MKSKEVSNLVRKTNSIPIDSLKPMLNHSLFFILAGLISRGVVFEKYAPFGPAFIAASPYGSMWTVVGGSILGYVMPPHLNGSLRYIATILAIATIRWTLNDLKKIKSHEAYSPSIAFIATCATGFAMSSADGFRLDLIIMYLAEACISAISAYFFKTTITVKNKFRNINFFSQQEFTCAFMSCCIIILALSNLKAGEMSIGRILAIIAILLCARYQGITGGSIAGISTGIIFSLSSPRLYFIAGTYAFGGLISGLFSRFGKAAISFAFLIATTIVSLQASRSSAIILEIYEVLTAIILFMLIPKNFLNSIASVIDDPNKKDNSEGLKRSLILRLKFVGKTLCGVANSVDVVSEKLDSLNKPNSNQIYKRTMDLVCSKCSLNLFCWQQEKEKSLKVFESIYEKLKTNNSIDSKDFNEDFAKRCLNIDQITKCVNNSYQDLKTNEIARRRVSEIRSVVSDHFSGMGQILEDMANEFELYEYFDLDASDKIIRLLKNYKLEPVDVSCRIDQYDKMSIEINLSYIDIKTIDKLFLSQKISQTIGRTMDKPCITTTNDSCKIQLSEKPIFDIQIGVSQHVFNNGTLCGDSYNYFYDGVGKIVIIISDGMGTGGRAAVDGAMASDIMSRLTKAGLSFESALRIVNSALFVKSSDESLATLDIICIDLFNGKVLSLKAGAPLTIIKKSGKTIRLDPPSLPAGILTDIKFVREEITLSENDTILMFSDGALALGEDFIETKLKSWSGSTPQDLSNKIINEILSKNDDDYDDDITVLAVKLIRLK